MTRNVYGKLRKIAASALAGLMIVSFAIVPGTSVYATSDDATLESSSAETPAEAPVVQEIKDEETPAAPAPEEVTPAPETPAPASAEVVSATAPAPVEEPKGEEPAQGEEPKVPANVSASFENGEITITLTEGETQEKKEDQPEAESDKKEDAASELNSESNVNDAEPETNENKSEEQPTKLFSLRLAAAPAATASPDDPISVETLDDGSIVETYLGYKYIYKPVSSDDGTEYSFVVEVTGDGLDEIVINTPRLKKSLEPGDTVSVHFKLNNTDETYTVEYTEDPSKYVLYYSLPDSERNRAALEKMGYTIVKESDDGKILVTPSGSFLGSHTGYVGTSLMHFLIETEEGRNILKENNVQFDSSVDEKSLYRKNMYSVTRFLEKLEDDDPDKIDELFIKNAEYRIKEQTGQEVSFGNDVAKAWNDLFFSLAWRTYFELDGKEVKEFPSDAKWEPGQSINIAVISKLDGELGDNFYEDIAWNYAGRLVIRRFSEPVPPPYDPPEDPDDPPSDSPSDPPSDPPSEPPVVPTVLTQPAPEAQVLGARRENGQAVLGARRAKTDDTSNNAGRLFIIVVAAGALVTTSVLGRKKAK
ncbi:hypothetical protein [Butyrivibrio hungatei]|uniref:Cell surface protein n=1 Tax=Butyrivibrio hungatei TaxID=185008 RepID=A0A1D9P0J5_9FIRM|nr:hypothetical protein [Butyrivibrio hungatei]AOZ96011.1 hypothetical protein bhn_I0977 [Butyrivibrio hungatei]